MSSTSLLFPIGGHSTVLSTLVLLTPVAVAALPDCRVDRSLDEHLHAAFATIRDVWPHTKLPPLPVTALSRVESDDPTTLQITLVRDARVGQVDARGCIRRGRSSGLLDTLSVAEGCVVRGPRELACSAGAVHALVAADPQRRPLSPALVMLLAHELSHLVHDEAGSSFTAPILEIQGRLSEDEKWRDLAPACTAVDGERQARQLASEARADADALLIMEQWLRSAMMNDGFLGPRDVQAMVMGSINASLIGLRQWQAGWLRRRDLPAIEEPPEGANVDDFASWDADRLLCTILAKNSGSTLVPQPAASHPLASKRLSRLSSGLASLSVTPRPAPFDEAPIGNGQELLRMMPRVLSLVDQQQADAEARRAIAFCRRVNTSQAPACSTLPRDFPYVTPACPELSVRTTTRSANAAGTVATATWSSEGVRASVATFDASTVGFARPLADGTVLVGSLDRLGFLTSQAMKWFEVPCIPRDALPTASGAIVVCDHPLGLIETSVLEPTTYTATEDVRFNDMPDGSRASITWIGEVAKRRVALFVSGSGETQTIDVTDRQWSTATPWRKRGCETLVFGMAVGQVGDTIVGTSLGSPSIPRTARFDAAFTHNTTFTARAKPYVITCGLGQTGPICLAENGDVFDPEPTTPRLVAHLAIDETYTIRSASLCSTASATWVLLFVSRPDGTRLAELHRSNGRRAKKIATEMGAEEGGLSCSRAGAAAAWSNGVTGRVALYTEQPPR